MLAALRRVTGRAIARSGGATSPAGAWYSREESIMGTAIRVELWSTDAGLADSAMASVMEQMHHVDRAMSPHKPDSELSLINREAGERPVTVSAEVFDLLARSLEFSRLSDGAFDITYASAGQLYDYRERRRPGREELLRACASIGFHQLQLDARTRTVRFGRPGMRIDLGGFAKGYAVEAAAARLRRRGIRHAIVSAGGDSRIVGDRHGRPWTVGIRDPRRPAELAAVIPLQDAAVSTSGDYERFFEDAGVRYHHILDPRTGLSPSSIQSVTIIAPDGLTSEGLSKSVFVLGLEAGMRLVESRKGVDAIVVDDGGVLHFSSGLQRSVRQGGS
jgi:FAD:protein FMN transferase